MPDRTGSAVFDLWLVVGAVAASLSHAALRFQQPQLATRLGFGYPTLSLFVLWALFVAFQAACWRFWTATRRR
jgi:hypothetical protein